MQANKKRQVLVGSGVIVVIVAIVAAAVLLRPQDELASETSGTQTDTTPSTSTSSQESPSTTGASTGYKDGTYSAQGSYSSPDGQENIKVTLVLQNGTVSDATVTAGTTAGQSGRYQRQFINGYKSQVVGKSIDSLQLSTVAGSSLTPEGFNDAVEQIKADAKA